MAKSKQPVEVTPTEEATPAPIETDGKKSQLEPKDFEGKSLMVCMPAYGGQMCAETASRLIDLNTLCTYFVFDTYYLGFFYCECLVFFYTIYK